MLDDSPVRHRLIRMIEIAFRDVVLGEGVSLHETIVVDHYGDDEERLAARTPDEKLDWRKLVDDPELGNVGGVGGLCFYDAAGLHFHLPAYMTMILKDPTSQGAQNQLDSLFYCLTDLSDYQRERFAILTPLQRQAVREFLFFLRARNYFTIRDECPEIDGALAEYWKDTGLQYEF